MGKKVIIALIIIIVLGAAGAYLATNKNSDSNTETPATTPKTSQNNSNTTDDTTNNNTQSVAATITYSNDGFSPSTITVQAGDTVAIKNASDHDMQFDSDPHPVHTDDTDLNAGLVSPGQTITFTVNKTGTFGYHNHLNPSQTGTIVIQ